MEKEITSLKEEHARYERDNSVYAQSERRYDDVLKEVRNLEGQLADFNLALDKIRTNTDVSEIHDAYERLKTRNEEDRKQIDEVFLKASSYQRQCQEIENRIADIQQDAQERMAALGEDLQMEFQELQEELDDLQVQISQKQMASRDMDQRITNVQADLRSPAYQVHLKGLQLEKRKKQIIHEIDSLEEETNTNMTPDELKAKLMQKIKDTNAETAEVERKIKKMEQEIEQIQDEIREKEEEVIEAKKHAQKAKIYDALFDRERQMQEFIDHFPEERKAAKAEREYVQTTIVALLRHISKTAESQQNLPSADKFADMQSELSFKEAKLQASKETMEALKKDEAKRREELEKMTSLDKKIVVELASLKDKIKDMLDEMETFKSEAELREEANAARKVILAETAEAKRLRDSTKLHIQQLSHAHEKKKRELAATDVMKRMESLEHKLRSYTQAVHQLSEYISTRKRESDYEQVAKEALALVAQLNSFHMANSSEANKPVSAAAAFAAAAGGGGGHPGGYY